MYMYSAVPSMLEQLSLKKNTIICMQALMLAMLLATSKLHMPLVQFYAFFCISHRMLWMLRADGGRGGRSMGNQGSDDSHHRPPISFCGLHNLGSGLISSTTITLSGVTMWVTRPINTSDNGCNRGLCSPGQAVFITSVSIKSRFLIFL